MLASPRLMATARFIPVPIAQRAASLLFQRTLQIYPRLFDRLGSYGASRFSFIPSDFPFGFAVKPARRSIETFRAPHEPLSDATIKGPLFLMLALAEGKVDGDAIFFARKLVVTGDMEAVLALRNALDDCGLDLVASAGQLAGPFRSPVVHALSALRRHALIAQGVTWN